MTQKRWAVFIGWCFPKATRSRSGRRRSGDLSSAPQCCCRVPSGFRWGSWGSQVWGTSSPLQVKISMGYRQKRVSWEAKNWKFSGVNFVFGDVNSEIHHLKVEWKRLRSRYCDRKWGPRPRLVVFQPVPWAVLGGSFNYVKALYIDKFAGPSFMDVV